MADKRDGGRVGAMFGQPAGGGLRLNQFQSPGGENHPVPAGSLYYGGERGMTAVLVYQAGTGEVMLETRCLLTGELLGEVRLTAVTGVATAFAGLMAGGTEGAAATAAALVSPTGWSFTLNPDGSGYLKPPRVAGFSS